MKGVVERIRRNVLEEVHHVSRIRSFLHFLLRILYHVFQKAWEDHFSQRAAALSFFTLLNLFPLTGLLLFILGRSAPFREHMAEVEGAVVEQLVTPAAREIVMQFFDSIGNNLYVLGTGTSGIAALLVLILLSTSLIVLVERSLNEIWKAPSGRGNLFTRISFLWMGVTLFPILLAASFALSARLSDGWSETAPIRHYVVPYAVTLAGFFLIYKFVPRVHVKVGSVLIGAGFTAVFWEAAKLGLSRYVELVFAQSAVSRLYGSLALVPIGMVWIFYSWSIVLLGAELCYVLQNLQQLQVEARRRWMLGQAFVPMSRQVAVSLLLEVVHAYGTGKGPVPPEDLMVSYQVHPDQTQQWFSALESAGLLCRASEGKLLPAKPPESIRVREVTELYDRKFQNILTSVSPRVTAWARAEEEEFLAAWGDKTLADLDRPRA